MTLTESGLRCVNIVGWTPRELADAAVQQQGVLWGKQSRWFQNARRLRDYINGMPVDKFRMAPVADILADYQQERWVLNLLITKRGATLSTHSLSPYGPAPLIYTAQRLEEICQFNGEHNIKAPAMAVLLAEKSGSHLESVLA